MHAGTSTTSTTSRLDASLLLTLAAGAIALLWIAGLPDRPVSVLFPEELYQAQAARDIAAGSIPRYNRDAAARVEPLYAALLAPARWIGGADGFRWWARIINVVLLLATVFPAYRLARYAISRGPAIVVATAAVLCPGAILHRILVAENLLLPLLTATTLAAVAVVRRPHVGRALVAGALLGAVALTDAHLIPLVPAVLGALLVLGGGRRPVATAAGAAIVVALPWYGGRAILGDATVGTASQTLFDEFARTGLKPIGTYGSWLLDTGATAIASVGAVVAALAIGHWLGAFSRSTSTRRATAGLSATIVVGVVAIAAFWSAQYAEHRGVLDGRSLAAVAPLWIVAFGSALGAPTRRPVATVVAALGVAAIVYAFADSHTPNALGDVTDFPAATLLGWLWSSDLIPGNPTPIRFVVLTLLPLALLPLAFLRRRLPRLVLFVALAWPCAGLAAAAFTMNDLRARDDARITPLMAWLEEHVEPGDAIVHHALDTDIPFQTALHFDNELCAVARDFVPTADSAVRFDGATGRFVVPTCTGRTLLLTQSLPGWSRAHFAKFFDFRLVDVSDGLAGRGSWFGLAPPPLHEPRSDQVTADRMCEPDTTIRWSVEYPHTYAIGIALEHPADSPIDGPVTVTIRSPNGGVIERRIEKGATARLDAEVRLWAPVVHVRLRCDRWFERDGRRLSLRITGLYLERR